MVRNIEIDWLQSEHVADLLAEDFKGVFRARVPSDDKLTHVAVSMMAVVAIPELHLVKRPIGDNAIGGFAILLFLRGFTLFLFFRGCTTASEAQHFVTIFVVIFVAIFVVVGERGWCCCWWWCWWFC